MATLIYSDADLNLNGVDLSDHVKSLTINYESEAQDDTAMGDTTRSSKGGLLNWSVSVEFHQDFAASEVDVTIFPIVGNSVPVIIKPTSAAVSATNPAYTGNGMITTYTPLSGAVGDLLPAPIEIVPSKGSTNSILVRDITP